MKKEIKASDIHIVSEFIEIHIDNVYGLTNDQIEGKPILDENGKMIGKLIDADEEIIYGILYYVSKLYERKENVFSFEIDVKENKEEGINCINDCEECSKKYRFPFSHCCLIECGQHGYCRGCKKGIYLKGEKEE